MHILLVVLAGVLLLGTAVSAESARWRPNDDEATAAMPPAPAPAPAAGLVTSSSSQRTTTPLVFGWRFQLGDLAYSGGPALCPDQKNSAAFPVSLDGRACALGVRNAWSIGHDDNTPAACRRACCTSPNCTLWSWFNESVGPSSPKPAPWSTQRALF